MVAALGAIVKTAVKSQVKKVAADKLMGRGKKKQPQQQKQSPNAEVDAEKKSGAIVKAPSSAMANIPLADSVSAISQTPAAGGGVGGSDTILVIKTRVVEIEKILKGSVALDKKILDQERKQREKELRTQEESELETPKDGDEKKVKKKKTKAKLGFLDGLINFIKEVLTGFILVRLIKFLPQLKKIVSILGGALDFFTNIALGLVDGLGTLLMWGDKAITGTSNLVKNLFGDKGAKAFDGLVGTIGNLFNVIAILGMTAAAFGGEFNRQSDKPRGKPRRKPNSLGDRARRMRRGLQTRAERATRSVRRTFRRLRPTNIKRFVQSRAGRLGKTVTNLRQTGSNILQKVKPSNLKQTGSNLIQKGGNFFNRIKGNLGNFARKQLANVDNVIGGIKAQGAKWAEQIGKNIKNMNPAKLGEKVKKLLKGPIDDILKKNKIISQLKNIKPKTAIKSIGKLMETTQKSGSLKTLMKGLEKAKAAKIGGVDKVIAAIMGVINYAALGESPINAILQAIGGLLGYTAGFAIGAPFGGAPGFITGMAGAFVGENAAKLLTKGLAQTGLANTPDPIANALGIKPRMMVRDPFGQSKEEESDTKTTTPVKMKELTGEDKRRALEKLEYVKKRGDAIKAYGFGSDEVKALEAERLEQIGRNTYSNNIVSTNNNRKKISSVQSYASYEESGEEVIVINSSAPSGGGGETQSNETMPVATASTGGGDDLTEALYEGG